MASTIADDILDGAGALLNPEADGPGKGEDQVEEDSEQQEDADQEWKEVKKEVKKLDGGLFNCRRSCRDGPELVEPTASPFVQ